MSHSCPGIPGHLVVFQRPKGYKHYAVNVGNGEIVHLCPREGHNESSDVVDGLSTVCLCCRSSEVAGVRKETFDDYNEKYSSTKVYAESSWPIADPLPAEKIVERALKAWKDKEKGFNLLWRNCETFARWCRYDRNWSDQSAAGVGAGVGGTVAGVGTAALIGGVSVLPTVGVIVGGIGLVAGTVLIIGTLPASAVAAGGGIVGAGGLIVVKLVRDYFKNRH